MYSPRILTPIIANDLVIGWTCRGCEWIFQVKSPRALDDYGTEAKEIIERAFEIHECETWRSAHGIVLDREDSEGADDI